VTPEESAALAAHNERVRALAARMPSGQLSRAICTIGYHADKVTGITAKYSVATMAKRSQRKPWAISVRSLNRAISVLTAAGVIAVNNDRDATGRIPANRYAIDYGYTDADRIGEAWAAESKRRRKERATKSACAICDGSHDPTHGGNGAEAWACEDCRYHIRHLNARR
jgi:hypothetical protein